MQELRLRFAKQGRAIYTSHLDLVRGFGRAARRAGIKVRHTQGFNPQPYFVFSPPISIGYASLCEVCDLYVEEIRNPQEIAQQFDCALPEGLRVFHCGEPADTIAQLATAAYDIDFQLSRKVTEDLLEEVCDFLRTDALIVEKKTKKKKQSIDIAPMLRTAQLTHIDECAIRISCKLYVTGEDALNPRYLSEAFKINVPQMSNAEVFYTRTGFYNESGDPFK